MVVDISYKLPCTTILDGQPDFRYEFKKTILAGGCAPSLRFNSRAVPEKLPIKRMAGPDPNMQMWGVVMGTLGRNLQEKFQHPRYSRLEKLVTGHIS